MFIKKCVKVFFTFLYIIVLFSFIENSFAARNDTIYIYNDLGTSENSIKHSMYTLKKIVSRHYSVRRISAEEIKEGDWVNNAALIIFPGGADTPYTQKLDGIGNAIIKKYVMNGGNYLGICAGSYYGSSFIEFDKGGKLEVIGKRELSFFPGKSIGPAIAEYDYSTNSGARAVKISTNIKNNLFVYYNGGGYFTNPDIYKDVKVISYYKEKVADDLPAILGIEYYKGKVILSGVHFEYSSDLLNKKDKYISKFLFRLQENEIKRLKFTKTILEYFNIKVKKQ